MAGLHLDAQAGKGQKQRGKEPDAAQGGPQTGADNQKARLQKQELAATASIVHEAGDAEAGEDGGDGGEPGDLQTEAAKPGLAVQPPTGGTAAAAHPAQVDTTVFVRGLPLDILQYELQVGAATCLPCIKGAVKQCLKLPPTI